MLSSSVRIERVQSSSTTKYKRMLTLQCSQRFLIELCTFMPLVCCFWRTATPLFHAASAVTADCELDPLTSGEIDCLFEKEGRMVCERHRACCDGREAAGRRGACWTGARESARIDEAIDFAASELFLIRLVIVARDVKSFDSNWSFGFTIRVNHEEISAMA